MNLSGSKTETNMVAAFRGESQARANYAQFAEKAKEEGHDQIASYFEETAINEQHHANIWLKFLKNVDPSKGMPEIVVKVGSTQENLQKAINGETFENTEMYPGFAKTAKQEGFEIMAKLFDQVSDIEKDHAKHFQLLLDRLNAPSAKSVTPTVLADTWKCKKCGNIATGKTAPASCGVCGSIDDSSSGFKAFKQESY